MLVTYGDTSKLKGKPFYALEVRTESQVESVVKRVAEEVPAIFRKEPLEIFIPVTERGLDVFEVSTGLLYVRAADVKLLARLKRTTGVTSLVTKNDTGRTGDAIPVEEEFVQALIMECEEKWRERHAGIDAGSFVRILDGSSRDLCGTVVRVRGGEAGDEALVRIDFFTKKIWLKTPVANLLNLSHVPEEQRVFFFGPVVAELFEENADAQRLIANLGKPVPAEGVDLPQIEIPLPSRKWTREKTCTWALRKLVAEGHTHPMAIAQIVVRGISEGKIKAPKNARTLHLLIKRALREKFKKDWWAILRERPEYRFTPEMVADIEPGLMPVYSTEPCTDGRSRAAKEKKKLGGGVRYAGADESEDGSLRSLMPPRWK